MIQKGLDDIEAYIVLMFIVDIINKFVNLLTII